ncbi:aconitate hydratase [Mycobacterium asiaticum]|uniref:3-isopropylmalate dehydratase small subunit n=1 Tax=Mycobacterium asiaticum TaxID=1790 RepID=A0A1A3NT14_MYCAS|nr:aconitate hydratase [Mycobacterium asiaticum]
MRGRAWVFGDDVNTDVIHPPSFFSLDHEVVKRGLFNKLDPTMQPAIIPGDMIIGGRNFGCGSSRETSIQSLLLNRIGAIVAADFARIFYRNATNNALPCVTFSDPADLQLISGGQLLELHFQDWTLRTDSGDRIQLEPPGNFVQRIWQAGGLLELLDNREKICSD